VKHVLKDWKPVKPTAPSQVPDKWWESLKKGDQVRCIANKHDLYQRKIGQVFTIVKDFSVNKKINYQESDSSDLYYEFELVSKAQLPVQDDPLVVEARNRYPVGTRFLPAHMTRKDTTYDFNIVTSTDIRLVDGTVYAMTDSGDKWDNINDPKYGNNGYNRTLYYQGKWAPILPSIVGKWSAGTWVVFLDDRVGNNKYKKWDYQQIAYYNPKLWDGTGGIGYVNGSENKISWEAEGKLKWFATESEARSFVSESLAPVNPVPEKWSVGTWVVFTEDSIQYNQKKAWTTTKICNVRSVGDVIKSISYDTGLGNDIDFPGIVWFATNSEALEYIADHTAVPKAKPSDFEWELVVPEPKNEVFDFGIKPAKPKTVSLSVVKIKPISMDTPIKNTNIKFPNVKPIIN
jgi:hypothetical protein